MAKPHLRSALIDFLAARATTGGRPARAAEITAAVVEPRATVNRYLAQLVADGTIVANGRGPATEYMLRARVPQQAAVDETVAATDSVNATVSPPWSDKARALRAQFDAPLGTRTPVTYQRAFVDEYVPNRSSLIPAELADTLFAEGRLRGQQPAGTYARKVLEQLLIDLSFYSSRLEGNRKSLLETRELFAKGGADGEDPDSIMLFNHKAAIEFIVDAVPDYGMTVAVVRNVHSLLMNNLLADANGLGAIRRTLVNIENTVYVPTQVPSLLEEMLGHIVDKARSVKNPVEAAFFLWVNIAYLQPFEDGNKRTSRLSANLPLLLTNCAPLSFLDVEPEDYAAAMIGVYERLDVTLAIELFAWTYRRSIPKYRTVLESMGLPDPFRVKYREHLGEAVRNVVAAGTPFEDAVATVHLPEDDRDAFATLLREELQHLEPYNCARFRLPIAKTEEWVARGRPIR